VARSSPRRLPVLPRVLLFLILCATLAACSSSASAVLTGTPAVTANGRHYSYGQGSVAKSSWPKVCSLVTTESASAVIGTAAVPKTFHQRCFYVPGNDAFPTLTVTILGIGSNQRDAFDRVRDQNARFKPKRIAGLGRGADIYDVSGSPTVNLDLLCRQGSFEIAVRSPVGNQLSAADARSVLVRVARVLNREFSG
jgi:hypothetical protein